MTSRSHPLPRVCQAGVGHADEWVIMPAFQADALKALTKAVGAKNSVAARQGAIDISHATLDLELRHRTQDVVDVDRVAVWNKQLQLDTAVGDEAGIAGDHVAIGAITDRINH